MLLQYSRKAFLPAKFTTILSAFCGNHQEALAWGHSASGQHLLHTCNARHLPAVCAGDTMSMYLGLPTQKTAVVVLSVSQAVCVLQGSRLEAQWAQSAAALLLELPKGQRGYQAVIFDRCVPVSAEHCLLFCMPTQQPITGEPKHLECMNPACLGIAFFACDAHISSTMSAHCQRAVIHAPCIAGNWQSASLQSIP